MGALFLCQAGGLAPQNPVHATDRLWIACWRAMNPRILCGRTGNRMEPTVDRATEKPATRRGVHSATVLWPFFCFA